MDDPRKQTPFCELDRDNRLNKIERAPRTLADVSDRMASDFVAEFDKWFDKWCREHDSDVEAKYEPSFTITVRRYRLGERLRAAWAILFCYWGKP